MKTTHYYTLNEAKYNNKKDLCLKHKFSNIDFRVQMAKGNIKKYHVETYSDGTAKEYFQIFEFENIVYNSQKELYGANKHISYKMMNKLFRNKDIKVYLIEIR
ncbi:hypothetical protein TDCHD05_10450 [Tenacibaculum dicentrarchi]|nr:hypothetical protein TDCHD05_10450 [Tenacibaculum dicentrarchi]